LLIISLWYLLSPFIFKPEGVRVVSISEKADCRNLEVSNIITQVEGKRIKDITDFESVTKSISAGRPATMIVSGGPGSCTAIENGDLGISVTNAGDSGLELGTDLVGGEKITLSIGDEVSQDEVSHVSEVIKARIKNTDMRDSKVAMEGKNIIIYTADSSELGNVIIKGRIEAVIEWGVMTSNGTGTFKVGDKSFDMYSDGVVLTLDGSDYTIDSVFEVDDIDVKIINITNNSVIFGGGIFDNNDIEKLSSAVGYVDYDSATGQYQFVVPISISTDAGIRFSKITEGLTPIYASTYDILDGMLIYYLDGNEVTRLTIPLDMAGSKIETISIVGGTNSLEDAIRKKLLFDMALDGEIKEDILVEHVEHFKGEHEYMLMVFGVGISSLLVVGTVILMAYYRQLKIASMGLFKVGLEVFYIFGVVAISQAVLSSGIVIDSMLLVSILVFSVITLIQTLMLSEKLLKGKIMKFYKKSTTVVFAVGFALLFTPLTKLGVVLILGEIISVLLTKPLYISSVSRSG
jgi:hypothetical protein